MNKKVLLEKIAELVTEKRLEGISDIRDESDKDGMRAVLELKRGEIPEVVLNNLYKMTQVQDSFHMNMVALVDGQPKLLSLKDLIESFISHRREVVTRRTVFELRKARERGHVLEGLAVALSNVDEVIELIKKAPSPADAKRGLMARAWGSVLVKDLIGTRSVAKYRPEGLNEIYGLKDDGYHLSDEQAQAILELRLQRLTALEQDKIRDEYREVIAAITDLLDILAKPARITKIIDEELRKLKEEFADKRKSEIVTVAEDISIEDLIAPQDMVVTFSHGGYVKSQPLTDYRAQRRGGRGRSATSMKEDDFIERLFVAHSHDYLLCFSNRGRLYWLKVYEVPAGSRAARGKPIVNMFPLEEGEKITAVVPVKEFDENHYVFMATAHGTVKKTPLAEFSRPRPSGIIAVGLEQGDYLVGAALTDGKYDVMLFSSEGKAVRFEEGDVRPMGRQATGVRGMRLGEGAASGVHARGEGRGARRADRDPERLWQAHRDGRLPAPRARRPGRDRDPGHRAQWRGHRRGAGRRARPGDADLDRRRADPHRGVADPRDGALDPGRDPDLARRGRKARGRGAHRGARPRQRQWR